jgi:hypothetical protein
MSGTDLLGYAASATVLATFCMTSMLRLRLVAIASNILFILFGAMAHIHPVLLLHLVLLPVNLARLMQIRRRIGACRVLRRMRSGPPSCDLAVGVPALFTKARAASTPTIEPPRRPIHELLVVKIRRSQWLSSQKLFPGCFAQNRFRPSVSRSLSL